MKKIFRTFLIFLISLQFILSVQEARAAASYQIADFLCQKGLFYYTEGNYAKALQEFKKALLANPESSVARDYINRIQGETIVAESLPYEGADQEQVPVVDSFLDKFQTKKQEVLPVGTTRILYDQAQAPSRAVSSSSELDEFQNSIVSYKKSLLVNVGVAPKGSAQPQEVKETVIDVDEIAAGKEAAEIQTNAGERVILKGKNILRFLVISQNILKATRLSAGEVLLEPQEVGSTYMHIWDEKERKTFQIKVAQRKWEEEFMAAAMERFREASLPESFKYSYSIQGSSFYTGRKFDDLQRTSHTLSYSSSLIGETPFGNFDTAIQGSRTNLKNYRVSNLRMGLTNGHYDQFKDITIRGFDFSPSFAAFGFPVSDLRGIMMDAPMFNKRLNHTTFWGALPTGDFTQLAPTSGFSPTKKAWLEGVGLNYKPASFANFKGFYTHSYGPELTEPVLTNDTSGFGMLYDFGSFDFGSDVVYDHIKNMSYTARTNLNLTKFRAGLSFTENNENFASLLGGPALSGSRNSTLSLNYRPTSDINIVNTFSATQDKVFGNPDRPDRPNYNSTTRIYWVVDPHTELELGYTLDDRLGSNAPEKTETKELTIRKKFFFVRKVSTFLNYQNRNNKSISTPTQNFNNNRVLAGLSFRIISDLFAYYRKEFNLLRNTFTKETAFPTAQEIGINYYRRIFDSPYYLNSRLFFRDEEDTESLLSSLSGEDRLEGEAEFTYRPNPDTEAFFKVRISNIWSEKEGVAKHLDADVSWGLRLVWDTGLRWQSVGSFYGYVFYDLNADGIKQVYEKGVKGAEIKGPDGKAAVADRKGYYKIPRVVGRQAILELNINTIPRGYNPTTSAQQEVDVVHAKAKRVDFGIATRSEISGLIFNDENGNGEYDSGEEPIKGVVMILDDKQRTVSSLLGEYMFRKLEPGEHSLTIDLKTVPLKFIPKVPVKKAIRVVEGATFVYHIPLQETKEIPPK